MLAVRNKDPTVASEFARVCDVRALAPKSFVRSDPVKGARWCPILQICGVSDGFLPEESGGIVRE